MSHGAVLDDLNFTAFMSSKICHDLVGPVGAISNGLELLEEETDEQTRAYALELIQFSANVARNRLEFARLAFGASSALGSDVDLGMVEKIARAFVEEGKHTLHWSAYQGELEKTRVRLLLTTLTIAMTAVPAGGNIHVTMTGGKDAPDLEIRCSGRGARIPPEIAGMLSGNGGEINPRSIIDYYAIRLAEDCGMPLTVRKDDDDIVFSAKTMR
ncbi:MAG TPA: histidine phosphotransferase family protein [Hyphomicrobiales bacterium]|nr:histidine phosphotransferase family protein [Hyphomicrobiales bacterium]